MCDAFLPKGFNIGAGFLILTKPSIYRLREERLITQGRFVKSLELALENDRLLNNPRIGATGLLVRAGHGVDGSPAADGNNMTRRCPRLSHFGKDIGRSIAPSPSYADHVLAEARRAGKYKQRRGMIQPAP